MRWLRKQTAPSIGQTIRSTAHLAARVVATSTLRDLHAWPAELLGAWQDRGVAVYRLVCMPDTCPRLAAPHAPQPRAWHHPSGKLTACASLARGPHGWPTTTGTAVFDDPQTRPCLTVESKPRCGRRRDRSPSYGPRTRGHCACGSLAGDRDDPPANHGRPRVPGQWQSRTCCAPPIRTHTRARWTIDRHVMR